MFWSLLCLGPNPQRFNHLPKAKILDKDMRFCYPILRLICACCFLYLPLYPFVLRLRRVTPLECADPAAPSASLLDSAVPGNWGGGGLLALSDLTPRSAADSIEMLPSDTFLAGQA